jgi:hypothetical protein
MGLSRFHGEENSSKSSSVKCLYSARKQLAWQESASAVMHRKSGLKQGKVRQRRDGVRREASSSREYATVVEMMCLHVCVFGTNLQPIIPCREKVPHCLFRVDNILDGGFGISVSLDRGAATVCWPSKVHVGKGMRLPIIAISERDEERAKENVKPSHDDLNERYDRLVYSEASAIVRPRLVSSCVS